MPVPNHSINAGPRNECTPCSLLNVDVAAICSQFPSSVAGEKRRIRWPSSTSRLPPCLLACNLVCWLYMLHPMDENKKEHVIAMAAKPAATDGTALVDASEDGSGAPFNTIFAGLALSIVSSHPTL